jgi:hypothetical protein
MGCGKEVIEYQPVNLDLPIAILTHKVRPGVVEISPPKLVPSGLRFYPVRCGKRLKSGINLSARVVELPLTFQLEPIGWRRVSHHSIDRLKLTAAQRRQ